MLSVIPLQSLPISSQEMTSAEVIIGLSMVLAAPLTWAPGGGITFGRALERPVL